MRSTEFSVSAGVKIPRFVFVPVHKFRKAVPYTEIKASYNYQDRPEYKRNIISYSFGYTGSYTSSEAVKCLLFTPSISILNLL